MASLALGALVLTSGCQTVRGMLKPYVCDCATGSAANAQKCPAPGDPKPDSEADSSATIVALTQQTTGMAINRAEAAAHQQAGADQPALRKLQRGASPERREQGDPRDVIDPAVAKARLKMSDPDKLERLEEFYGVSFESDSDDDTPSAKAPVVFRGNFALDDGQELAVVRPDGHIEVFSADQRIAHLQVAGKLDPKTFTDLGFESVQAVRLVRDGSIQLMVHWRETGDDGTQAYKVGLFKLIGPFVGKIFTRTLAVRSGDGAQLQRRGTYEILRGETHRHIRWIPADDSGELLADQAVILQWNRWEGAYRAPKPPPTAPDRQKLRTHLLLPQVHATIDVSSALARSGPGHVLY